MEQTSKLLIIGAGSFSTEVDELARLCGYTDIAFVDDKSKAFSFPLIGTMDDIGDLRSQYESAIVAIGNNEIRKQLHEELLRYDYNIPILIHPTAYVSSDAEILPGCIVRTHSVVSRYAKLNEGVIVNIGALVDHHCQIGEFSMILPGAVVRNSKKIEPLTWIDANEVKE